jgi:heme-degrading monooxygenase HmoA/pimeloyl-ACP methyl ester carboxylesterase
MCTEPLPMDAPRLDPGEEHFRIPSPYHGRSLFLRYLTAPDSGGRIVLYVHGGTFPPALSIAHRFDGRSWRDELEAAGHHVWALDSHGFGRLSDPYPEMDEPAEDAPQLCCAEHASRQLEVAARFICNRHGYQRVSIIAHSWGAIVTGRFAAHCPELVDRSVLFGPIARREPEGQRIHLPAWRLIFLEDQWKRFTETVPRGEPPVLLRRHFGEWGEGYLDPDPQSRTRSPAAVKVPSGPFQDIYDAWSGELSCDPSLVRAPVAIIRGEWDGMCTDRDARWLFDAVSVSPIRRDVKISRGTHLMHLEGAVTRCTARRKCSFPWVTCAACRLITLPEAKSMFAVIFEVNPKPEQWDTYLGYAGSLRPELERIDGFIDNERFSSLQRPGWVLSLSIWRDEKAVIRWRTSGRHHEVQQKGRNDVFRDYHLRVGEITCDNQLPAGQSLREQRFDETEAAAKLVTLSEATPEDLAAEPDAATVAARLGASEQQTHPEHVDWDVFKSIYQPGKFILLTSWRDAAAAERLSAAHHAGNLRHRRVRVIRDYGMFDRTEAPQYYPPVVRERLGS